MIDFILYSNLYLAFGAAVVAYTTAIILGQSPTFEILLIPFAGSFFIYTLNRYTDMNEDRVNVPVRVQFFDRYGKIFLGISAILYCTSLVVAFMKGFVVFVFAVFPLAIGLLYSFLGLKKLIFGKNLSVGLAWGFTVLLTGAFYNHFSSSLLLLFAFFTIEFFVNTVIFDIKDIKGDQLNGIITFPIALGMKRTQYVCYSLNATAMLLVVWGVATGLLPTIALLLSLQSFYVMAYTYLASERRNRLYFGLFVDGEFLFLLMGYLSAKWVQTMTANIAQR